MRDPADSNLLLYTTSACSACDAALDLLQSMPELRGRTLRTIDVANDDALVETYGPRLPVLAVGGRELAWPFTAADVADLTGC